MKPALKPLLPSLLLSGLFASGLVAPATAAERTQVDGLEFSVEARTAEQLIAFYTARGLPANAVDEIARHCFLTVGMRNKRKDTVWLIPARWRFIDETSGRALKRMTRAQWQQAWQRLNVPAAARNTFGWTQLPERRDLQPDEPVGGNIALVAPQAAFTLIAEFPLASENSSPDTKRSLRIRVPNLRCGGEESSAAAKPQVPMP